MVTVKIYHAYLCVLNYCINVHCFTLSSSCVVCLTEQMQIFSCTLA